MLPPEDAARHARKVFATYLPWFESGPGWDHWRWSDRDPEKRGPGERREVAAARYPAAGPYDSRDDAVLGYHLLLLNAAGFDGLFVNWYGRGNRIDAATRALFDKVAAWRSAYGLRFGLSLMVDAQPYLDLPAASRVDELARDLEEVLAAYAPRPEYQRVEGKPLLLFFPKPDPRAPERQAVPPEAVASARKRLSATFWLGSLHPDPTWRGATEVAYGWIGGAADSGQDYGASYLEWLYPAFAYQRRLGWDLVLGIGIAYPGFDDGPVHAWSSDPGRRRRIARDIGGKATLDLTWDVLERHNQANPGAQATWVQVATFNDWNEGSEVEPSVELGTGPLEAVARRASGSRGSAAPAAAAWSFPERYLERRRAGIQEPAMAPALAAFIAGDHAAALARLP